MPDFLLSDYILRIDTFVYCLCVSVFFFNFSVNPNQFQRPSGNRPHQHSQCFDYIRILNLDFDSDIETEYGPG